jgi:hypothetical protein
LNKIEFIRTQHGLPIAYGEYEGSLPAIEEVQTKSEEDA